MRFAVFVKATAESEACKLPDPELFKKMGAYNEELVKAGIMLAAEGLHPSSKGARITFSGSRPTVIDGPFTETKELVAGFWLIQVKSREEAIEWISRAPFENAESVEIRQIFDFEDFGAQMTAEVNARTAR
jgi:hypothetical protein